MCFYLRITRALISNLFQRAWTEFADWAVLLKRRSFYFFLSWIYSYDDIGPSDPTASQQICDQSSLEREVEGKPWYFSIDRKTAQELVMAGGNGCYVVRKSTKHPLTLTLWYNQRSYNIPIRRREDGTIALGAKKNNERTFVTVDGMIECYKKEDLILFSGGEKTGETVLKKALRNEEIDKLVNKQQPFHVLIHVPQ